LTSLICKNFITVRLINEQIPAQHIPLLSYIYQSSPWELLDGLTEPFFRGVAIPFMETWCAVFFPLLELCTQLKRVLSAGALSTNFRKTMMNIS